MNLTGLAGSSNTTGDEQKKLDVISNDLFIAAMRSSGKCALLVSEEEEKVDLDERDVAGWKESGVEGMMRNLGMELVCELDKE